MRRPALKGGRIPFEVKEKTALRNCGDVFIVASGTQVSRRAPSHRPQSQTLWPSAEPTPVGPHKIK
jgi:hypothetical protein